MKQTDEILQKIEELVKMIMEDSTPEHRPFRDGQFSVLMELRYFILDNQQQGEDNE